MVRYLKDQAFVLGKNYIEAAGLSTDTKPTAGIVTGSRFLEVNTGNIFEFDEVSGTWTKVNAFSEDVTAAVNAWLDDHPEATTTVEDGAITYAKLDSSLKETVDEVPDLKSAINKLQDDVFNNDVIVPIDPATTGTSFDGFYINNSASTNNKIRFTSSSAGYRVFYFPPAQQSGKVKAKASSNYGVRIAVAKLVDPVIAVGQTTFDVPYVDGYVYAETTTSFTEVNVRAGDTVMMSYKSTDTLTVEGSFIKQDVYLSENVIDQVKNESEIVTNGKLINYTKNYFTYTDNIENGNISSTGQDSSQSASKTLRTTGVIPIKRKTANIYVSRNLMAIPSLGAFIFYFFKVNGDFIEYKADIVDSVFPPKDAAYMRYKISTTGENNPDITPSDAQYINVWQVSIIGNAVDNNEIKWCAMGDSITQGWYSYLSGSSGASGIHESYTWAQILAGLKNWNLTNIGIGGTGYVRGGYTGEGSSSAPRLAHDTNYNAYDIVTLAYGVNDWKGNRLLGSPTDAPLTNEEIEAATGEEEIGNLCKNMKYVIEKILSDNPNCKIVVITPINCAAYGDVSTNWGIGYELSQSGTLEDVFEAEKAICEYYGISYIDMTHSSVVNRLNMMTACYDGVHPSILTHRSMAREINARIGY